MKILLKYETKVGTFYIGQSSDGRFHPIFDDEYLGSYAHIFQATEDLSMDVVGSVMHPETGELLDLTELGIPEDPGEWERCY